LLHQIMNTSLLMMILKMPQKITYYKDKITIT
jgi:hypothetical protein